MGMMGWRVVGRGSLGEEGEKEVGAPQPKFFYLVQTSTKL
jgi:hypothetical protein